MKRGVFNDNKTKAIAEICEKLYIGGGVSGVTDYANLIGLKYGYCVPCEAEMPMIQYKDHNDCACCGSVIKDNKN